MTSGVIYGPGMPSVNAPMGTGLSAMGMDGRGGGVSAMGMEGGMGSGMRAGSEGGMLARGGMSGMQGMQGMGHLQVPGMNGNMNPDSGELLSGQMTAMASPTLTRMASPVTGHQNAPSFKMNLYYPDGDQAQADANMTSIGGMNTNSNMPVSSAVIMQSQQAMTTASRPIRPRGAGLLENFNERGSGVDGDDAAMNFERNGGSSSLTRRNFAAKPALRDIEMGEMNPSSSVETAGADPNEICYDAINTAEAANSPYPFEDDALETTEGVRLLGGAGGEKKLTRKVTIAPGEQTRKVGFEIHQKRQSPQASGENTPCAGLLRARDRAHS